MAKQSLCIENLTMQFGGVVAVNNLSMTVNKGEIVALIGPNGAGKTTVFNIITGVYQPTNGLISLDDKVLTEAYPHGKMKKLYEGDYSDKYQKLISHSPDQITQLGIARTFQNIRLFREMSIFDNVLVAKHLHLRAGLLPSVLTLNRKEEKQMREETLSLIDLIGLGDIKDQSASSLPYGKQRQLEIIRALATKPRLLLLDEPAAGMNPQETDELSLFIRKIRQDFDVTVFLIEHHMNLVMDISDRIYVIDFGKLIAFGTPAEVQDNPDVIQAYLGADEE